MTTTETLDLDTITARIQLIASEQLALPLSDVTPDSRILEDLNCDSLDLVELIMELEEEFGISLADDSDDPIYKVVFTRSPFRIRDFGELVYHQLQRNHRDRSIQWLATEVRHSGATVPFTQFSDSKRLDSKGPLFASLGCDDYGNPLYRRRTDGMRCVQIHASECEIGCDSGEVDECPAHRVALSGFMIDLEPVSVAAFCCFLNAVDACDEQVLSDWFALKPGDHREPHLPLRRIDGAWRAQAAVVQWPMMLVSWYGANAYSRWANGLDWKNYRDLHLFADGQSTMPSEAQWEYAARGPRYREFPWGGAAPTATLANFGAHRRGRTYALASLPLSPVNEPLGLSPFGLFHMAGNVWQWCADWYCRDFYRSAEAQRTNPLNVAATGVRSERGGSWIGTGALLRSSYRRGRAPHARGRCLGFRCTSAVPR